MPDPEQPEQKKEESKLVTPYCGGCGHLYFKLPKEPEAVAKEKALDRRCEFCVSEANGDDKTLDIVFPNY